MNNNVSVKIAVAETSVIIRSGLTTVLKRLPNLNVVPIEVSSPESLQSYIHLHTPDLYCLQWRDSWCCRNFRKRTERVIRIGCRTSAD